MAQPSAQAAPAPDTRPPPGSDDAPLPAEPPGDPNDRVLPMAAPNNQPRHIERRKLARALARDSATRRRFQLTVLPAYAAVALDFIGRPRGLLHGAGAMVELDVPLWRYLWFRATAQATAHPLREETAKDDDDKLQVTAPAGLLSVLGGSVGLAYALDFSRMLAMIDLGIGGALLRQPSGPQNGQRGQPCRANQLCDPGLACNAIGLCEPTAVPMVSAGLSAEWLLGKHLSLGATVRYHALLAQPGVFPVYLMAMGRVGIRF